VTPCESEGEVLLIPHLLLYFPTCLLTDKQNEEYSKEKEKDTQA
jgi:hypothetical protein